MAPDQRRLSKNPYPCFCTHKKPHHSNIRKMPNIRHSLPLSPWKFDSPEPHTLNPKLQTELTLMTHTQSKCSMKPKKTQRRRGELKKKKQKNLLERRDGTHTRISEETLDLLWMATVATVAMEWAGVWVCGAQSENSKARASWLALGGRGCGWAPCGLSVAVPLGGQWVEGAGDWVFRRNRSLPLEQVGSSVGCSHFCSLTPALQVNVPEINLRKISCCFPSKHIHNKIGFAAYSNTAEHMSIHKS